MIRNTGYVFLLLFGIRQCCVAHLPTHWPVDQAVVVQYWIFVYVPEG